MTVVNFRKAEDRLTDQVVDRMFDLVDGQDTLTGISACLQTLAMLIAGYGESHGDASGLADRCGTFLSSRVADLAAEMESQRGEQSPEATA